MICRYDNKPLTNIFIDLGHTPIANALLTQKQLNESEIHFPLKLYVSERSFLVQIEEYEKADKIFNAEYTYFSSYSSSWLQHAKNYVNDISQQLNLGKKSFVVEIASNDGYLLRNFVERDIRCLGIEPSENTAIEAKKLGVTSIVDFFGEKLAEIIKSKHGLADLIVGNNVFAHTPNIHDFLGGLKTLLAPTGTINLEFPHLYQLIEQNQFDTIYHEHYWYFSLFALIPIFESYNLEIYDVKELHTHGGSIRLYVKHKESKIEVNQRVNAVVQKELKVGMDRIEYYQDFPKRVMKVKNDFLKFLIEAKNNGKKVAAYGAAAKGNTMLNFCGIKNDYIEFVADLSPHKQNKYLPGSHIPIVDPREIENLKPDYVVILPWNLKTEIMKQLEFIRKWDGEFVVSTPKFKIF